MLTNAYTQVVIQPSTQCTFIQVHRHKRFKVQRYDTSFLTRNQLYRLYRVLTLSVWEQSVEFSYDLSPVVTLDTDKPVVSRKNRRLVEIMRGES